MAFVVYRALGGQADTNLAVNAKASHILHLLNALLLSKHLSSAPGTVLSALCVSSSSPHSHKAVRVIPIAWVEKVRLGDLLDQPSHQHLGDGTRI